ncbi:MAG: integration host factor subunit beta [Desulfobacterota bacterium]|nr:integration host factor subunit beta [Thermodesulfobacteriota bacterium]MDW8001757.1 HU family DNA-binding protein [Deltaproteobacteria bacterium]
MNKADLIAKLAERKGLNLKIAKIAVDTIIESIKRAIVNGERVEIRGFGSFSSRQYGAYIGRNPKTGEKVNVKPKRLPYFKVGKELKEMIMERKTD